LFIDYIDVDPDSLEIEDVLVTDNKVVKKTSYLKDPSKYKLAKKITLHLGDGKGLNNGLKGNFFNSFDVIKKAVSEIERFYALSGESEINFQLNQDYMGLHITFIVIFNSPEGDSSNKIDEYLGKLKDMLTTSPFNYKKFKLNGNWLEFNFAKKDYMILSSIQSTISKIQSGAITLDNNTKELRIPLINLINEINQSGHKIILSGGDNQLVIKIEKQ